MEEDKVFEVKDDDEEENNLEKPADKVGTKVTEAVVNTELEQKYSIDDCENKVQLSEDEKKVDLVDLKPFRPKLEKLEEDELYKMYKEMFMTEPTCIVDLDKSDINCEKRKRCMNALCESGEDFVDPPSIAKSYYSVPDGKNLKVCKECLRKALDFYLDLEVKFRAKQPICDAPFPSCTQIIIIDDDEDGPEKKKEKKEIPPEFVKDISSAVESTIKRFDKEYDIKRHIDDSWKCLKTEYNTLAANYKEIDATLKKAEEELSQAMRTLYETYLPKSKQIDPYEIPYEEMRPNVMTELMSMKQNDENDCMITGQVNVASPANLPPIGKIVLKKLKAGDRVYAMKVSVFSEWVPSYVEEVITRTAENGRIFYLYKVVISGNVNPGYKKDVSAQLLAYYDAPTVRIPVGTRIISEYTDTARGGPVKFFSGIVAEMPSQLNKFRYLVFFDDGKDQYVNHTAIRLVCEAKPNVWEHFKTKFQPFIRRYTSNFPERAMLKVKNLDCVKTEYKGMWVNARVVDIDCSLVKLIFLHDKHSEWIYRGSHRFYPMYQGLNPRKGGLPGRPRGLVTRKTGPYVQYDVVLTDDEDKDNPDGGNNQPVRAVARKSSTRLPDFVEIEQTRRLYDRKAVRFNSVQQQNDGQIIQRIPSKLIRPKCYRPHSCDNACISWVETKEEDTKGVNPLATPVLYGFARETDIVTNVVSYVAPCGRRLRSIQEVLNYLTETQLKLSIDMFDFDPWVNIFNEYVVPNEAIVLKDLSFGIENIPIVCVNTINGNVPTYMDYMTQRRGSEGVNMNLDPDFLVGCDCTDNCQDKTKCACWQLTMSEGNVNIISKRRDFQYETVGYQYKRLPNLVATGIYECNSRCKCCTKTCLNRVVQQPLKHRLQLFMTKNKGWGTRCLNDIPAGTFICVYVGNIFTEAVANEDGRLYGDEYFAELDYIEVVEANKDGYEDYVDPDEYLSDRQNDSSDRHSEDEFEQSGWAPTTALNMNLRKRTARKKTASIQGSDSDDEDDPDVMDTDETSMQGSIVDISDNENSNDQMPKRQSVRCFFGKDESVYIMDAKAAGNIGRYLNHSCDPNIFVQNVFVDTHDLRFPWVAFFSLKYIRAGTELTWDYRYDVGSVPGKKLKCYCSSDNCRGRLL